jgi:hypothetical protein
MTRNGGGLGRQYRSEKETKNGARREGPGTVFCKKGVCRLCGNVAELWSCAADACAAVTLSEFVHTTSGVDEALLTCEVWVATGADTDLQVLNRGDGLINLTTSAGDRCFVNRRMALFFHGGRSQNPRGADEGQGVSLSPEREGRHFATR